MGSPCPPCNRLRGANLELLPHVNNLLGPFFGGGSERGTHESLGPENTHSTFESSHISLDGKQRWGLYSQECKQHHVPDLCDLPKEFQCAKPQTCRGISF